MDKHKEAVAVIATDVRRFYERGEPYRIYHGSTNSTRKSSYQRDRIIDTSSLVNVLHISRESQTALVEPNVSMDCLVQSTMEHGLVPLVVMEFPGITVGGGFAGTAGESSSFKHGLFDCTINRIEIVLANGEVVLATDSERSDLLSGAAGSCGTLGVITLLEVQLMEAARFVELTYHPSTSIVEAIQKIQEETSNPSVDYIDGIIFSPNSAVVMTGRLRDTCPAGTRVQRYTRAHDPWFYQHAEQLVVQHNKAVTEAVPLVDYLFRYDRGGFWGGAHAFKYFMTPFNRATRWMLDYFMHTRVMYHALHESGLAEQSIAQDIALPFSTVQTFIEYIDDTLKIYPLWLCPVRPNRLMSSSRRRAFSMGSSSFLPTDQMLLLNVGVWGMGPRDHDQFVTINRRIEQKVRELSGLKCLYAHAYYTEEEFWDIYDRTSYQGLRVKYHATSLPTVYDKVKVVTRVADQNSKSKEISTSDWLRRIFWNTWPLSGLYGVYRAALGGDYLLRVAQRSGQVKKT